MPARSSGRSACSWCSGNFVVGAVIFLIITLVQFIVITKGAERVAEVAARFTLDAMPGKQMSIDADLRAGIIDFNEARKRREGLARESQFYGAMDGAMKFVKGDAIAGIVITVINIVGGLIIGVAMNGMSVIDAVQTYSILTIGNGLVSQIPALLISISAGMVVTRVASEAKDSNLGKDVASQILGQPKAIAVASGLLTIMALIPGLPKIPFFLLAGVTGSLAWGLFRAQKIQAEAIEKSNVVAAAKVPDPQLSLTVPLVLQASEALTPFVDLGTEAGQKFYDQLLNVRNGLYYELGVIFPSLQVKGHAPGEPGSYTIWANEVPVISGQIRLDAVLINDSAESISIYGFKGENTAESGDRQASRMDSARTGRARQVGRLSGLGHPGNSSAPPGALPEEKRKGIYRRPGSAVHGLFPETELSDAGGRDRAQASFASDSRRDSAQAGGRRRFHTRSQSHPSSPVRLGTG